MKYTVNSPRQLHAGAPLWTQDQVEDYAWRRHVAGIAAGFVLGLVAACAAIVLISHLLP